MKLCWHCCHEIPGETLELPYKHDDRTRTFYTMGQFCSWGCMKTFNLERNRPDFGVVAMNITALRRKMYGKVTPITPAPRRWLLKCFGGDMDIHEFRAVSDKRASVWVNMPDEVTIIHRGNNVVSHPFTPTQCKSADVSVASRNHMMKAIKNADTKSETLKLKRPIPLKSNQNTLENSLGLTLKKSSRK